MVRVSSDDVKTIMNDCPLEDVVIDVYIKAANTLVNKIFGFTDDTVTTDCIYIEIEKWMAAHMIACTRFRITTQEQVDDAKIVFAGKYGMGLDSTPYGQMVKMLDTTGLMAVADKKQASIYAVPQFDELDE